jgi:thioredoxin 1
LTLQKYAIIIKVILINFFKMKLKHLILMPVAVLLVAASCQKAADEFTNTPAAQVEQNQGIAIGEPHPQAPAGDLDMGDVVAAEMETHAEPAVEQPKQTEQPKETKPAAARYVDFNQGALIDAQTNSEKTVLFFYASWCPYCKTADADFRANLGNLPNGLTILRVDYTKKDGLEADLAKKFGVTYQHTYVQINSEGEQVTKWIGGETKELLANLK